MTTNKISFPGAVKQIAIHNGHVHKDAVLELVKIIERQQDEIKKLQAINAMDLQRLEEAVGLGTKQAEEFDARTKNLREELEKAGEFIWTASKLMVLKNDFNKAAEDAFKKIQNALKEDG